MEIVINKCYGGFSPSNLAIKKYFQKKGKKIYFYAQTGYKHESGEEYTNVSAEKADMDTYFMVYSLTKYLGRKINNIPDKYHWYFGSNMDEIRIDKDFVSIVKELGEKASTRLSNLKVVTIPDDIEWEIDDYDGIETVHEVHRSW